MNSQNSKADTFKISEWWYHLEREDRLLILHSSPFIKGFAGQDTLKKLPEHVEKWVISYYNENNGKQKQQQQELF